MKVSIFNHHKFHFPYEDLKFPGQATEERILFIGRESPFMLWFRLATLTLAVTLFILLGFFAPFWLPVDNRWWEAAFMLGALFLASFMALFGWWWLYQLWKKSVFVITNRRLAKYIYTTPWNRYSLSLGLDKIVDTGAYAKTYFEVILGIGTFTARSGAGNRKDKYFYLNNIHWHEDLANYLNKVLFVYNRDPDKLSNFRPFIGHLKGEPRQRFMRQYPEYWS